MFPTSTWLVHGNIPTLISTVKRLLPNVKRFASIVKRLPPNVKRLHSIVKRLHSIVKRLHSIVKRLPSRCVHLCLLSNDYFDQTRLHLAKSIISLNFSTRIFAFLQTSKLPNTPISSLSRVKQNHQVTNFGLSFDGNGFGGSTQI